MRNSFLRKKYKVLSTLVLVTLPVLGYAQAPKTETLFDFFNNGTADISTRLTKLALIFILAFFIFGVLKYVNAGDSADKRGEGVKVIIHGLIALFVAVSIWGIVSLLLNTFGITPEQFQPRT
jgi:hypothetical protein